MSACIALDASARRVAGELAGNEAQAPVRQLLDELEIVRRDQQRHADLVEAREELHDLERQLGVEVARRLVGDQHVGTRRDGARDTDALLLARRQRDRRMRLAAAQADLIERRAHAFLDLAAARARDHERQRDVVEHAAVVEQLVVLEHDAEPLAKRRNLAPRDARRVLVVDEHGAARRPLDERDQAQQRALAGARRARQEHELAALDVQRYARQRLAAGRITFVDVLEPDHGRASPSSARTNSSARKSSRSATPSPTRDEPDRHFELPRDREQDAAFRRAVELRDGDARELQSLVKFQRLRERVLALARVEHEQHLVRRRRVEALDHALDLVELVHEPGRGVQAARRCRPARRRCRARAPRPARRGRRRPGPLRDPARRRVLARARPIPGVARRRRRGTCPRPRAARVCPLAFKRCASLPTVVVLPVPLTPTAKITNGLCAAVIASGASTVRSKPSAVCAQQLDGRRAGIAFVRGAHLVDEPRRRVDADVGASRAASRAPRRCFVERLRRRSRAAPTRANSCRGSSAL